MISNGNATYVAQVSGWYVFEWMQTRFKGCVYHSRENTALVTTKGAIEGKWYNWSIGMHCCEGGIPRPMCRQNMTHPDYVIVNMLCMCAPVLSY